MSISRLLPFVACLYCFQLLSQPTADFTSSVSQGCSPLVVDFFDNSTGSPNKWKWDFGNGSISFVQDPSVSFNTSGFFTVTLIVTDSLNQSDTITKINFIEVLPRPDAAIGIPTVNSGCIPFDIQFADNSSGGSGTIFSWLWDFGDGSISSLQNPINTYNIAGVFSVSLQIIDSNGCVDFVELNDTITTYPVPTVDFSADTFGSCLPPLLVNFQNNSTTTGNITYLWKFGDGSTSTDIDPAHSYSSPGIYSVELIASDPNGCSDSLTKIEYISVKEPEAIFSVNIDTGCLNPADTFIFFNQSKPASSQILWNFGDGSSTQIHSPLHNFSQPGIYNVSLIVSSFGCSDTMTRQIVFHQVDASFKVDTNFACNSSNVFQFSDQSFNAWVYNWSFGDGSTSNLANPDKKYNNGGTFKVMLEVENKAGCVDTTSRNILIRGPLAKITADFQGTCIPINITLRDSIVSTLPIISTIWDLGYTTVSGVDSLNFTWDSVGTYSVNLIVTDSIGCVDTAEYNLLAGELVSGVFMVIQDTICADEKVQFVMVADTFTEIFWSDGVNQLGTSVSNAASYLLSPGYWLPTAFIEYNGCVSPVFPADHGVEVIGMRASLVAFESCDSFLNVKLDLNVFGAYTNYTVDLGNGSFIDTLPLDVTYSDTGKYQLILIMSDSISGCVTEDTIDLELYPPPQPGFTITDSIGCSSLKDVSFDATGSFLPDTLDVFQAYWVFGNGDTVIKTNDIRWIDFLQQDEVNYNVPGIYSARLIFRYANSCFKTKAKTIRVYEHRTAFGIDSGILCTPTTISFVDSTMAEGQITSWLWTVDGKDTVTNQNASFYFQNQGAFLVELVTTDTFGCKDSKSKILVMNNPHANIGTPSRENCVDDLIIFYNLSVGQQFSSFWEFGDGNTSNMQNPLHIYTEGDSFTVKLTITDNKGCVDSVRKKKYMIIHEPLAAFALDPDSGLCPPLLVSFTDSSQGNIVNWSWNLGDGAFSSSSSPSHNYSSAGSFDISLTVTDDIGCVDSVKVPDALFIGGPTASYRSYPDSICRSGEITFEIFDKVNVSSVLWDFGDGVISSDDTVMHIYDSSGSYNPVIILDNGLGGMANCIVSIPLGTVYVDPVKASFDLNSISQCSPTTIQLIDNSVNSQTTRWVLNALDTLNSLSLQIDTAGVYEFHLYTTSAFGCKDSSSRMVEIFDEFEVNVSPLDTTICPNEFVVLNSEFDSSWSYLWIPSPGPGLDTLSDPAFSVSESKVFVLTVEDENGCVSTSDSIYVRTQQELSVTAYGDTLVPFGSSTVILASANQPVAGYLWSPPDFLNCFTCRFATSSPENAITYVIQVQDTLKCYTATDTIVIVVSDNIKIELPDAFSPNNDEVNDVIYPRYRGVEELIQFSVYNRYGERLFTTNKLKAGWDGRYEGNIQNVDTYFYLIEARSFLGEEVIKKGSFILIK